MREGHAASHRGHRRDRRRLTSRAADGTRRGARGRQRHSLTAVKRVIAELGSRMVDQAIDARTSLGRALAAWPRA